MILRSPPPPHRQPSIFSDVIVVTLGAAGYWVVPLALGSYAGEFFCDAVIVDAQIRTAAWLCG